MEPLNNLAKERTLLANERTMLAHIRTALSSILVGLGLIKFFAGAIPFYGGFMLLLIGAGFAIAGIRLYIIRKRKLNNH